MIYSMTGFAAKSITITGENNEKTHIFINMKSLNSRFFDTTCKFHYALSSLEHPIVKRIKKILRRGHVYCTIHISNPNAFRGAIQPSMATVESYLAAINTIQEKTNIKDEVKLSDILSLPNIFSAEEKSLSEDVTHTIFSTIDELLQTVHATRAQEGASLLKDFQSRIALMQQELKIIAEFSHEVIQRQKEKVHATIEEVKGDESLLATAQRNALYTMLDKLDLNEEIVRFDSHLEALTKHLASEQIEKGKRIDFTLQELAREINTIASKCSDARISEHAINIKVEIEKAREQTQNIV